MTPKKASRLLVLCLAGLAAGLLWCHYFSVDQDFSFVQISDTHISPNGEPVLEVDTAPLLRQAVREINDLEPPPEFIVHTGDIAAFKGSRKSYRRYQEMIAPLKMPIYYALGNHDKLSKFRKILLGEKGTFDQRGYYYSFSRGKYLFIVLHSQKNQEHQWILGTVQLQWLKTELSNSADKKVFIFLHHPLFAFHGAIRKILEDRDQLLSVIEKFSNVRLVIHGHAHQAYICQRNGVYFVSSRALARSYNPDKPIAGYRLYEVQNEGTIDIFDKPLGREPVKEDLSNSPSCHCLIHPFPTE